MNKDILNQYRKNRKHQFDICNDGGGMITTHVDSGKVDRSYGGAVYGFHAASAYDMARSHINFCKRFDADIATFKKRSAAAKRGWKKRSKANVQRTH